MVDEILQILRTRYGEDWANDDEANLRFRADAEYQIREVDGVHLIGTPEVAKGEVTLRVWVDRPVDDLMTADCLAFAIFGRLSEDLFFSERRFEENEVRYPFVTGSAHHGHVGALVLSGPHAAAFASRYQVRSAGVLRFHA